MPKKEDQKQKVSICITDPESIRALASCQRTYSEMHGEISPSVPKMAGLAFITLEKVLLRQKETKRKG